MSELFFLLVGKIGPFCLMELSPKNLAIPKNFDKFPNIFCFVTIFPFDEISLTVLLQKKSDFVFVYIYIYIYIFCVVTKNCYKWGCGIIWF